ncbi:MAG: DUF1800 domain-containing protein [Planctomycetales bacterium]|nr:DUF1800 domain-containing protein [Planctomycetales bacterium]
MPHLDVNPDWAWAPYEPSSERPYDLRLAAHLHRRAGFGATLEQLRASVEVGPAESVSRLLEATEDHQQALEAEQLRAAAVAGNSIQMAAGAWLHRMLHSPAQAREKLTLFWHGHFASGDEKVQDVQLMQRQNDLLRTHALGDFGELAREISRDPAMLIYLDSATNRKSHPNENYARELMELFCLGEGNYTETDVLELARCFTGWGVKRRQYKFNPYQHDDGEKQLLGQRGAFSGEQAVNIVLDQPHVEQFIAGKLVRYLVMDEPAADARLLAPLAKTFRDANLHVAPLVERILRSNLFFSEHAVARKIRSPIELVVGMLRPFSAAANVVELAKQARDVGQGLYFPPNVKGWDGGRTWINTSTLLGRANLARDISLKAQFSDGGLDDWAKQHDISSVDQAAEMIDVLLLATPATESLRERFASLADNLGDKSLRSLLHGIASTPQCQLG